MDTYVWIDKKIPHLSSIRGNVVRASGNRGLGGWGWLRWLWWIFVYQVRGVSFFFFKKNGKYVEIGVACIPVCSLSSILLLALFTVFVMFESHFCRENRIEIFVGLGIVSIYARTKNTSTSNYSIILLQYAMHYCASSCPLKTPNLTTSASKLSVSTSTNSPVSWNLGIDSTRTR